MSEEEKKFERSQTGHDANDLHKHGGFEEEAHEEDKTERENLEEAIEALDESDDIEEIKEESEDKPEEKPEEVSNDAEFAAPKEPETDWKKKEDNRPYMTVDEVIEPKAKKKGGAGWKVATVFFLLLAIAGCGAAAYLFFNNGKVEFLGRRVVSESSDKKVTNPETPNSTPIDEKQKEDRAIYLDGYNLALKIPDTLTNVSYEYHQNNEGGCPECTWSANYSTLEINAAYNNDAQSVAPFVVARPDGMNSMGSITITTGAPQFEGSVGDPVFTIETDDPDIKYYVYYDHPQQGFCQIENGLEGCMEWEGQSIAEIEKMLTTKDNYIQIKK